MRISGEISMSEEGLVIQRRRFYSLNLNLRILDLRLFIKVNSGYRIFVFYNTKFMFEIDLLSKM